MATIGDNIKKRREELGMTQEELAKILGYKSKSTINKIEMGINDITQSKVVAFADALKTTPAYLMGWKSTSTDPVMTLSNGSQIVIEYMKPTYEIEFQENKRTQQQIERLLSYFTSLNDIGRKKALDNIEDLAKIYSDDEE